VLIVDDFGLDAMDATGSRDVHEILTGRDRVVSIIITSNRSPDEWLGAFADPVRAQAAIDRFTPNAYDLVIDGESYRKWLKLQSSNSKSATKAGQNKGGSGN
jgi:DNA replication protein DnaC